MTLRRRWAFGLGLLLSVAVALELGMRLAGFMLLAPSDQRNEVAPEDEKRLRILTIGESTTADFFSGGREKAWPHLLEEMLRRSGIDARVYNEAIGGTTTPIILTRLLGNLDKYRPQIVISMMGINDTADLRYGASSFLGLRLWISQFRLVKLAEWIGTWFDSRFRCKIDMSPSTLPDFWEFSDRILEQARSKPIEDIEDDLRKQGIGDRDIALVLAQVGTKLREGPGHDSPAAYRYFNRAFDLSPLTQRVAYFLLNDQPSISADRCREVSLRLLACGRNLPDDLLSEVAYCLRFDPKLADNPTFRSRGLLLSPPEGSSIAYHYRIFHEMLRQRGVWHVAMQYPTLPVQVLKSYFADGSGKTEPGFEDIAFASNQDNFSDALKHHPYDEVFQDRFRTSWGHTTSLGYQLIADSAYHAVIELIGKRLPPSGR